MPQYEQVFFTTNDDGRLTYWIPRASSESTDPKGHVYVVITFDGLNHDQASRALTRRARQASNETEVLCLLSTQPRTRYIDQGDYAYIDGTRIPGEVHQKSFEMS
jgi:hypothetical protein